MKISNRLMKSSIYLIIFLVSCGSNAVTDTPEPTIDPSESVVSTPQQDQQPSPTLEIPDDKNLVRGTVFINTIELMILESYPIQVMLAVAGELPTPCDSFGFSVELVDADNQIHVEVYSLAEPGIICVQVLQAFEENISILSMDASLEDGTYSVWVNGEMVGEFNYPGG